MRKKRFSEEQSRRGLETVGCRDADGVALPACGCDGDGDRDQRIPGLNAHRRPRFEYLRLTVLLHRGGYAINHKRIFRLYTADDQKIRRKRKKIRSRVWNLPSRRLGTLMRAGKERLVCSGGDEEGSSILQTTGKNQEKEGGCRKQMDQTRWNTSRIVIRITRRSVQNDLLEMYSS